MCLEAQTFQFDAFKVIDKAKMYELKMYFCVSLRHMAGFKSFTSSAVSFSLCGGLNGGFLK